MYQQRCAVRNLPYFLFILLMVFHSLTVLGNDTAWDGRISAYVEKAVREAHIPGVSVVLISGDRQSILCYGVSDIRANRRITPATLFQLGSCSKAFTALAVMNLERGGLLKLDDDVSVYIPWLQFYYRHKKAPVTLRQLLHHTSGIPWKTISKIPADDRRDALETTVRELAGGELDHQPG